ncbi:MAG: dynamin family protein [Deltaproteobacteria bacterium]|nr:dynamin family protein [Deltaproteobacteria bacterium]
MQLAFTFAEYRALVRRFAARLPALLVQHPATAELAVQVERLDIEGTLEGRFSVAVVGQMRAGKSTLLNALMGQDLAPTGVNETTATINWFRHGRGEQTGVFRVNWRDGTATDVPIGEITAWLGKGEAAQRTRWLDFFADSPFLAGANLIDTPGTRSVLASHEGAVRGFVLDDAATAPGEQAATDGTGQKADAILYVVNPVAKESDADLLAMFDEKTRMAGAHLHNSIAVVQKWEHLGDDPLAEAERKCARIADQLAGKVAQVLPTSGLLGRCTQRLSVAEFWQPLADIAHATSASDLSLLLEGPEFFADSDDLFDDMRIPQARRVALAKLAPWPVVRLSVREAARLRLASGEALRQRIWHCSGLEQLQRALHERFFRQAELIKANTVLRRAWQPCNVALGRLHGLEQQQARELARAKDLATRLGQAQEGEPAILPEVRRFVATAEATTAAFLASVHKLRRDLDDLREEARRNFEALDGDLAALERAANDLDLPATDKVWLLSVFGAHGLEVAERLGLPATAPTAQWIATAESLLERCQDRAGPGAKGAWAYRLAGERLEHILDLCEARA